MSPTAILPVFPTGSIDLLAIGFRAVEIAFAALIAGINVANVRRPRHMPEEDIAKPGNTGDIWAYFIYTEAVAGVASLLAVILAVALRVKITWPVDFLLFILWMVAFGLLIGLHDGMYAKAELAEEADPREVKWVDHLFVTDAPLIVVFSMLSGVAWLASGIVNITRCVIVRNARLRAEKDALPASAPVAETAPIHGAVVGPA